MDLPSHPRLICDLLVEQFPLCFKAAGQPKLPLKIGIHLDILDRLPGLDAKKLRSALHNYTARESYRRRMRVGADRFDLDGLVSGTVSEEHAGGRSETVKAAPETPAIAPSGRPILRLKPDCAKRAAEGPGK